MGKVEIGGQYRIGNGAPDSERWLGIHLLDGVVLEDDGAWAGICRLDARGWYVAVAFTDDDEKIPAIAGWGQWIVRDLSTTAPAAAQAA